MDSTSQKSFIILQAQVCTEKSSSSERVYQDCTLLRGCDNRLLCLMYRDALRALRNPKPLGIRHPLTISSLENQAEIAECREGWEKSPRAFWAFRRLGHLQFYQKKYSEAVQNLQHAIRGYSTSADLWELSRHALIAAQNAPATTRAVVSVENVNLVDTVSGLAKIAYPKCDSVAKGMYMKCDCYFPFTHGESAWRSRLRKQDASDSWGISVGFISIILLPIVGNAAEHTGSVIFALKNKDISLGVSLGSATQISAFVIPLCDIVRWIMGVPMDLDFGRLQSASLAFAIVLTSFTV
ncbi:hypothetical protein ACET3Z_018293 [Daucus carota]